MTSEMFVTKETRNGRHGLNIWRLEFVELKIEIWIIISLTDKALLTHTSRSRCGVRTMQKVEQSMIANCDYRKAEWASSRDADH